MSLLSLPALRCHRLSPPHLRPAGYVRSVPPHGNRHHLYFSQRFWISSPELHHPECHAYWQTIPYGLKWMPLCPGISAVPPAYASASGSGYPPDAFWQKLPPAPSRHIAERYRSAVSALPPAPDFPAHFPDYETG